MKRIMVATDFSTRSDGALRRAVHIARTIKAEIVLVYAVDEDRPKPLVESDRREAGILLGEMARAIRDNDSVSCEPRLIVGDPFRAIVTAAEELSADLVVIGPHRRNMLQDMFIGTTAERAIRHSTRPVIIANATPASPYKRVLIATDFSECAAHALRTARNIGLFDGVKSIVLHAFDAPARGMLLRAATTTERLKDYIADERKRAEKEMEDFLRHFDFKPSRRIVELAESSAAQTILKYARSERADLIVLGTRGITGVQRFLLGGVAADVLRKSDLDVLSVPPV